jgi:hypothetical protein
MAAPSFESPMDLMIAATVLGEMSGRSTMRSGAIARESMPRGNSI